MTPLLAEAFQKIARLPARIQDELAMTILEEVDWNAAWNRAAGHEDQPQDPASNSRTPYDELQDQLTVCIQPTRSSNNERSGEEAAGE